jgi:hypothetical protein
MNWKDVEGRWDLVQGIASAFKIGFLVRIQTGVFQNTQYVNICIVVVILNIILKTLLSS